MQSRKISVAETKMYNQTVNTYNASGSIPIVKGCFAYMFTNLGSAIARVNGMVIFPSATPATDLGDSRTIAGHENDLYYGNLQLSFEAAGTPLVEIVQLYYILAE